MEESKTFTGIIDSKSLLDCSQFFKKTEGKKLSAMLPKNWKKWFNSGFVLPAKKIFVMTGMMK